MEDFTLEPLDTNWLTNLFDFFPDFYGGLSAVWRYSQDRDKFFEFDIDEHDREAVKQNCMKSDKGNAASMAFLEYKDGFKWIERPMHYKESGRRKNKKSLKNLKQCKVEVVPNKKRKK